MNEAIAFEEFVPWVVVIITLMGGLLRVLLLGIKGMWLDETFSVWIANHTVGEIVQLAARFDQHPPLYYLLLHYWIALKGDTAYYARLLSALIGTATIPVMYLIGKRLSGIIVGLAAAALLALSPFNVYFAQETRMYTLLAFNAAVAIYALVRLLTDPRAARPFGSQFREYLHAWRTLGPVEPDPQADFTYKDLTRNQTGWRGWIDRHRWSPIQTIETDLAWVGFIVFSAATLLSHNTAVFFVLAVNIFVLGLLLYQKIKQNGSLLALQAPSLRNWVIAQLAILLLWSPWLFAFIQQAGRVDQEFWIPKPGLEDVGRALRYFLNAAFPERPSQVVMTWLLCGVLCLGVVYYRKKLSIFIFLATLFCIPILGELIVSIRRPIFLDKTLIWVTIPLLLLLAAGIAQLKYRMLMFVVLCIFGVNYLFSVGDYFRWAPKEDWITAAGYVANFAQKDDLVLFNDAFVQIPFDYYFKEYEALYSTQVEKRGVPADMFASGILEPKMTESDIPKLLSLIQGRERVWLVYSHDSYTDPLGLVPQTLAAHMTLLREREFYGGKVQLYGK